MKKLMISIITILFAGILIVVCMRYFRGGAATNQEILTDEEIHGTVGMDISSIAWRKGALEWK